MKKLMKMVLGAGCVGLRLLLAQLVLGAGSVFASIPTPEVKFTFDTPTDNCWPENEGKSGQYVSFMGSYSSKGANQGATYVESMLGKGVHSYSPWCIVGREDKRDPYTVEFCFKATTAANNILLCLGNLNSSRDAIMVTTESAHSIKLVRVRE